VASGNGWRGLSKLDLAKRHHGGCRLKLR
jgi:hypothetical protein